MNCKIMNFIFFARFPAKDVNIISVKFDLQILHQMVLKFNPLFFFKVAQMSMINVQDVANSAITKMAIYKNCTFSIKSVLIVSLNTILNEFE